jgi:ABC-type multidrug transport system fused ATPase/permease subunit
MVPQDGFLFAMPVRENIRMGRDDATDAEIVTAIADLGLTVWVESLPGGLDTEIGPGGDGLSVGERQLVAVVRAALADPGVLILDEATSSLDPATERAMTEALDRLKQGRTTVTVAHRLSTAERADLVVVFGDGRIVETGTHEELVSAGGEYTSLYEAWSRGVAI